jgi:hypothetical protein
MADDRRFENEVLSMTTAQPGWRVHVRHDVLDTKTKEAGVEHEGHFPIVAWAVVKRWYVDGESFSALEPVFVSDAGQLSNETQYRWMHSDVEPDPGDPKITVAITIVPPADTTPST